MGALPSFLVLLINTLYHDANQEKNRKCGIFIFYITPFTSLGHFKKIMGNDWNPDAPEVKIFFRAEKAEQKVLAQERRYVSKLELGQLRKERAKSSHSALER